MARRPIITGVVRPWAIDYYRSEGEWPTASSFMEQHPSFYNKRDAVDQCLTKLRRKMPSGPPPERIVPFPASKNTIDPEKLLKIRVAEINKLLNVIVDLADNAGPVQGKSYTDLSKHQQELILELERRQGVDSSGGSATLSFEDLQKKASTLKKKKKA